MNNNKFDDRYQTDELASDPNFQPNFSFSQHFSAQHFSNMGIWVQQPTINQERLQLENLKPEKSTSTIVSRFESPASAFYATEICMRFPQYESQVDSNYNPSLENYDQFKTPIELSNQTEPISEFRNSLQPIVKPSQLCSYQYNRSCEKINSIASAQRPYSGDCNSLGSLTHMSLSTQKEKQLSPRHGSVCSANPASSGPVLSSKTRIRWTQDLHEKFVECLNRLGGAEKATPKAILKLMDSEGLTIFHIKSHLQKYRIAKYLPDPTGGTSEKRCNIVTVPPPLDVKNGLQVKEALQLQLDVQKRLHEQLEIQRNLQVRIEEQGKQLQMMFDMQQKSTDNFFKTT